MGIFLSGGDVGRPILIEQPSVFITDALIGRLYCYVVRSHHGHNVVAWLQLHVRPLPRRIIDPNSHSFYLSSTDLVDIPLNSQVVIGVALRDVRPPRSEEHTSELQ